jgi:hypothetical protein
MSSEGSAAIPNINPQADMGLEMRTVYTRAKRRFRLVSFVISALSKCTALQAVEDH